MKTNEFGILINCLIGLSIFLFSIKNLSINIENYSNKFSNTILHKFTDTYFKCFLIGVFLTAISGSSTLITLLTLTLISSKQIPFKNALIIVISSNIGTSFSTLLFSFNLYFILPLIFLLTFLFLKSKTILSFICFFLGLLIFGLNFLIENLQYLYAIYQEVINDNLINNNSILMFFLGILLSFFVQSSNATIALIQKLSNLNIINLSCGISFVLGANIGTTITPILASLITSKEAKKISLLNFFLNFFGSLFFLLILPFYTKIFLFLNNKINLNNAFLISLSHIIYNFITVLIFLLLIILYKKPKTNY